MRMIELGKVVVPPNRQRREFPTDAAVELMQSISETGPGLLHPIVLRGDTLVAGERRLRAAKDLYVLDQPLKFEGKVLPLGMIPANDLGELSEIERMEAELAENIHRVDITWQERAEAVKKLVELRRLQDPTIEKKVLLAEVGSLVGDVNTSRNAERLTLAHQLHDPEISGAKTEKEALKILTRKIRNEQHRVIGESLSPNTIAAAHTFIKGDAFEWFANAPPEQFDVILTDPPYGMGADKFGDSGGIVTGPHEYVDSNFWPVYGHAFIHGVSRIAKKAAHLYVFLDIEDFLDVRGALAHAGWRVHRTPLMLIKPNASRVPWPEHGPRRSYELILYALRGDKHTIAIYSDVMTYAADENLGHAAQKPVAAYVDLLRRSVRPGDRICDPFAGTGTIFTAAQFLKCIATGVEWSDAFAGIIAKRLETIRKGG